VIFWSLFVFSGYFVNIKKVNYLSRRRRAKEI
jgi:hypothetical protein